MVLSVGCGTSQPPVSVGAQPYIESVFDNELVDLDATATLAAAEANEHTLITAETRRLQITGLICIPARRSPRAGCPAPNTRSGWAGTAPRPSATSRLLNSAAHYACPTAPQPG